MDNVNNNRIQHFPHPIIEGNRLSTMLISGMLLILINIFLTYTYVCFRNFLNNSVNFLRHSTPCSQSIFFIAMGIGILIGLLLLSNPQPRQRPRQHPLPLPLQQHILQRRGQTRSLMDIRKG